MHSYIDLNFSSDVLTMVAAKNNKDETLILASFYMPHDDEALPAEFRRLADAAEKGDANAYNTVWGSSDTNDRGESLLNFILISNLAIANRGEEPTYMGPISKNILDVKLHTITIINAEDSEVLRKHSFSDHNYVEYQVKFSALNKSENFRNLKNTNWDLYRKIEIENLTRLNVGDSTSKLEKGTVTPTNVMMSFAGGKIRDIRKTKRESWKSFCGKLEKTNAVAGLRKLLSKPPTTLRLITSVNLYEG